MTKKLCIEWAVNGGKGYSSPRDDTPENAEALENWIGELRKTWPYGKFAVTEYPHSRDLSMAGCLLLKTPSGHS